LIREDRKADVGHYKHIVVPDVWTTDNPNAVRDARTWHRGEIISCGAPALTRKGVEVPHGFKPGDVVLFHWGHLEKMWTLDDDGLVAVPQDCVSAVLGE
jgi:co-chaperonin GroES (HSP10)